MAHAAKAEARCGEDSVDNPAVGLAAFLYDNYAAGRDKFSFLTPKRGRVLGLWIEQLVAESLGKDGQGVLPNIEVDPLLLTRDPGDRSVVMYQTKTDLWDERMNFEMSLAYIDPAIPRANFKIDSVEELAEHFVMWEYAVAMCGYLMKVCPFDQPDVASAKAAVLDILHEGQPACRLRAGLRGRRAHGRGRGAAVPLPFRTARICAGALQGDCFADVQPRRLLRLERVLCRSRVRAGARRLEAVRHGVAERLGVASCLEVGPRYLHSTGQLHKGGPNTGVFLILSADELKDVPLSGCEAESLGALAKAQATGDLVTLAARGRRCLHLHLPDNSGVTLRALASVVNEVLDDLVAQRAGVHAS